MNISRNNYEIFFLDYLEGRLNPEQISRLMRFLEFNPDLKHELNQFDNYNLEPEFVVFGGKESLKNIPNQALLINDENFDELCIASIEGDLTTDQRAIFDKYILVHPEKLKTYKLFNNTRLIPENVVFEDKSSLKRYQLGNSNKRLFYIGISSIAAVLALVYFYFGFIDRSENSKSQFAHHTINNIVSEKKKINNSEKIVNQKKTDVVAENKAAQKNLKKSETNKIYNTILPVKENIEKVQNEETDLASNNTENKIEILGKIESKKVQTLLAKSDKPNEPFVKFRANKLMIFDNKEESKNFAQLAKVQIRKIFLKKEDVENLDKKITFWDVADATVRGLSRLTGRNLEISKTMDSNGRVETLALRTESFEILTSRK